MADTPFFDPFDNGHQLLPSGATASTAASPFGHFALFGHAPSPIGSTPTPSPPSFPAPPSSSAVPALPQGHHPGHGHGHGYRLSTAPPPHHHLMRTKRRYDQVSPYHSASSLCTTTDEDGDDDSSHGGDGATNIMGDLMDTDTDTDMSAAAAPHSNNLRQKHKRRRLVASPTNPAAASVPVPLPGDSAFNNPNLPPAYFSVLSRQLDGFHISDHRPNGPPIHHQHVSYTDANAMIRAARQEAQMRLTAAAHEQAQAARQTYQGTNAMLRELHRQRCLARGLPVPEDDEDDEDAEEK